MMVERVAFATVRGVMEKKEDFIIPEDIAEWIGLKKSEYLSELIMHMEPDDFGFEEFTRFDEHIPSTIERPDKVIEQLIDGYVLRTFIRTYQESDFFHQLIIGMLIPDPSNGTKIFVPILTIVSRKDELVKLFSMGQTIARPTLN